MNFAHSFDVFPAIDLLDGQSVRLRRGARESAEIVHPDPLVQLREYRAAGARWVHVVNLNAAFGDEEKTHAGASLTLGVISTLVAENGIFIQLGGGIRSIETLKIALESGASRVVIGTWATTHFDVVMSEVRKQPSRFVIGVDSLNGLIAVHGWTKTSSETTLSFASRLKLAGAEFVLFTEVERDGMLQGAAVESSAELAAKTGLQVIASGGVRNLDDVRSLATKPGICGVVTGRALAAGTLLLSDALMCSRHA